MTQGTRMLLKAALGLACLIAIGIYAYYGVYLKSKRDARARLEAQLIFRLDKDSVTSLDVEQHGKRTRVERTGKDQMQFPTWSIVEPIKAPGDNISINSLLGIIERLESERILDDTQAVDPKTYGLQPPRGKLILKTATEESYVLLVGKKSSFGNLLYVRPEGEKVVYLIKGHLEKSLLKNTYALRLKELVPIKRSQVTKLVLKIGGQSIVLQKQEGAWKIISPLEDQADSDAVNGLLASLASLRAQSFRDNSKVALSHYGLDPPMIEVQVYSGSEQQFHGVVLGKGDLRPGRDVYFARTINPPGPVVEIQENNIRTLKIKPFDLRSKTIMDFDKQAVFKIKSASDQELLVLEKTLAAGPQEEAGPGQLLESWSLVSPRAAPVDKSTVEDLLQILTELSAHKFLGDKRGADMSAFGLDHPVRTVTLYDQEGKQLADLKISRSTDAGAYVASGTRTQVCLVSRQRIERIPIEFQKLLGDRAEQTGPKKP